VATLHYELCTPLRANREQTARAFVLEECVFGWRHGVWLIYANGDGSAHGAKQDLHSCIKCARKLVRRSRCADQIRDTVKCLTRD